MATNIKQGSVTPVRTWRGACAHPTVPASNNPVRALGDLCGTALTDEDAAGETTVLIDRHIAEYSVKGIDGGGNSAVAVGDKLYYTDADDPVINKKTTGKFVGYALGTVGSSLTATIPVLVNP